MLTTSLVLKTTISDVKQMPLCIWSNCKIMEGLHNRDCLNYCNHRADMLRQDCDPTRKIMDEMLDSQH